MVIYALFAAAVLLFFFGLLWPEKSMWLKWITGAVGAVGTLFVAALLWALWVTDHVPVIEGRPVEKGLYVFSIATMLFVFWSPALGLLLGRVVGRFVRKAGSDAQETHF